MRVGQVVLASVPDGTPLEEIVFVWEIVKRVIDGLLKPVESQEITIKLEAILNDEGPSFSEERIRCLNFHFTVGTIGGSYSSFLALARLRRLKRIEGSQSLTWDNVVDWRFPHLRIPTDETRLDEVTPESVSGELIGGVVRGLFYADLTKRKQIESSR